MTKEKSYISVGDFIDLYYKLKQKGMRVFLSGIHLSDKARTVSKWNASVPSSDFWIIPAVRRRWNEKCTGNPDIEYEDYVVGKYLAEATNLRMLSVGCGTGARERKFAKYAQFVRIDGIDMASKQVEEAVKLANDQGFDKIQYHAGDFLSYPFETEGFDVILFNSSLHHFPDVDKLLTARVKSLLKPGGMLVVFEYAGPGRLQWTNRQLQEVNSLLKCLPPAYRLRVSGGVKRRVYRPGIWRMLLIDPSEAIDSPSIVPALHKYFRIVEEKQVGWDITHLLFKDIAHNFLGTDAETYNLIRHIFKAEDEYMAVTGRSDAVFGIYKSLPAAGV